MLAINSIVDYTLLEPSTEDSAIIELCHKANQLQVKSVCVLPEKVSLAANELKKSTVLTCTVVSFPQGNMSVLEKESQTKTLIEQGADEIDVVMNYAKINDWDYLLEELKSLAKICRENKNKLGGKITLKVIVESGLLSLQETEKATNLCIEAGVDYIKTSTGKVAVGAELSKIKCMKAIIEQQRAALKIKASGGIRDMKKIEEFMPFVDRLGIGYKTVDELNTL